MSMEGEAGLGGSMHPPRLVPDEPQLSRFRHNRQCFIIDSGATLAMTPHIHAITEHTAYDTNIMIANSTVVISVMMGRMGAFTDVRVIDDAPVTVLPISALANLGYDVLFTGTSIILINANTHVRTLFATRNNGIMTVCVDDFHGILFEEQDDDLPDLVPVSSDDDYSDDDDTSHDNTLRDELSEMGILLHVIDNQSVQRD